MSPKPLHEMTEIELIPFKIHAICYDLGYNIETARIMFYIYHQYHQNYKQEKESENALELMLGIKTIDDEIKKIPNQAEALKAYNFIKKTVQDIKRIDFEIKESTGIQNRLYGELNQRLKYYKDQIFKTKMRTIYSQEIQPKINNYSIEEIHNSFQKQNLKEEIDSLSSYL